MGKNCEFCGSALDMFDDGTFIANILFCENCYNQFGVTFRQCRNMLDDKTQRGFRDTWFALQNAVNASKLSDVRKEHALHFMDDYLDRSNLRDLLISDEELIAIQEEQKGYRKSRKNGKCSFQKLI